MASRDSHSSSTPETVRVRHVALDLQVDFDKRVLSGSATLSLERTGPGPLVLDTRDLVIRTASAHGAPVPFALGARDAILGAPLTLDLPGDAREVTIEYSTVPEAR